MVAIMQNFKRVMRLARPFDRIKANANTPEAALFMALISQMIIDASNISSNKELIRDEKIAKEWLREDNDDLDFICEMVGLDKRDILSCAYKQIEEHRMAAGFSNLNLLMWSGGVAKNHG